MDANDIKTSREIIFNIHVTLWILTFFVLNQVKTWTTSNFVKSSCTFRKDVCNYFGENNGGKKKIREKIKEIKVGEEKFLFLLLLNSTLDRKWSN